MKVAKYYKFIQEHPHSFELHDERDGRSFHVAKHGLSSGIQEGIKKIQAFASGGGVEGVSEGSDPALLNASSAAPQMSTPAQSPPFMPAMTMNTTGGVPAFTGDDTSVPPASSMPTDQIPTSASAPTSIPTTGTGELSQTPQSPMESFAKTKESGLASLEKGVKGALGAETAAHNQTAKAWKDYGENIAKMETPESIALKHKAANDAALSAFQTGKIDPDHYWNSKSTGAKISAGLGMILGGLGSGLTGGPNMAVQAIHQAIDRDIESQKNEQSKNMNLWKMNREAMGDELSANLQTRNQLLTAVEAKTKMFAQSMGGAEAQLKFAPLLMDIEKQKNENNLRMGLMKGDMSELDPAHLVPMLVKNPEQQEKVYKEIQAAQNTKHMANSIMKNFEDAVKENTVLRTGAGLVRTPASVYGLHQAMQPTFADLEGTVRQAAMDNTFKNITPMPGDSEHTIQQKRESVKEYLQSKASAPIAKGNGIDLSRFSSTSAAQSPTQEMKKMGGVDYVKVPGGWKRAQ